MPRAGVAVIARLLVAVALLLPAAMAQGQAPVLVENVTPLTGAVDADADVTLVFSLVNLNRERAFFVSVGVDGLPEWERDVEPERFFLEPGETRNVTVLLAPPADADGVYEGVVEVNIVDTDTGAVTSVTHDVAFRVERVPLVLGTFQNPLPSPLDNAYGVFLLDIAFWALVGLVAYFAGDRIVRYLTRYARRDVTRIILAKLRWPLFFFVFLVGLRESFGVLPRHEVTELIDRLLGVIAIGIVGLYLLYRLLDASVFYYQKEVAPRTRTKLDDILAPFLRKVVVVVVILVGLGYYLSLAGLSLGVVFGAAGIMGIVIGLAAQETLANFFAGVFILFDRPFLEGDDIQLETGEVTRVERIGLRSTRLYHYRNHELIILPNNDLASRRVINLSYPDQEYKIMIDVGVAYGSNVEKVKAALLEAASEHPLIVRRPEDEPLVRFMNFGDNALMFMLRFGVTDYRERFTVASDVRERIDAIFRREGIEVPFPQRTLWMRQAPELKVTTRAEPAE